MLQDNKNNSMNQLLRNAILLNKFYEFFITSVCVSRTKDTTSIIKAEQRFEKM